MARKSSSKALIGRQDVMDYLSIGKSRFYELIRAGMPVMKVGYKTKVWIGHTDEVDEWFRVGLQGGNSNGQRDQEGVDQGGGIPDRQGVQNW